MPLFLERLWDAGRAHTPHSDMPWTTRHRIALLIVGLIALAVGWHIRPLELMWINDDAIYLALSQSIRDGGYSNTFLATPTPHTKYPPGNPAWIAVVQLLTGDHIQGVQAANLLLLVATSLLMGDAVRRVSSPWTGVVAASLIAWNEPLLRFSGTILSEVPFTFVVSVSVWAALRAGTSATGERWVLLASGTSLAAFLVRLNGIAVIVAVGVWLLVVRRWRAAAAHVIASALVVGVWGIWVAVASVPAGAPTYASNIEVLATSRAPDILTFASHLLKNARVYNYVLMSAFHVPNLSDSWWDGALWMAVVLCATVFGAIRLRHHWPVLFLNLGLAGSILLVWPWALLRLAVPLVCLFVPIVCIGIETASGVIRQPRWARRATWAVGIALAASSLRVAALHSEFVPCAGRDPYEQPGCFSEGPRNLVRGARLARDILAPGAILASGSMPAVWHFSGHRVVSLSDILGHTTGFEPSASIDHRWDAILVTGFLKNGHDRAMSQLTKQCATLRVLATTEPSALLLVRRADGEGDACEALARLVSEKRARRR